MRLAHVLASRVRLWILELSREAVAQLGHGTGVCRARDDSPFDSAELTCLISSFPVDPSIALPRGGRQLNLALVELLRLMSAFKTTRERMSAVPKNTRTFVPIHLKFLK